MPKFGGLLQIARNAATEVAEFCQELGPVFTTRTSDMSTVAYQYLCGLIQVDRANLSRMEEVVPQAGNQRLHHFVTESPWDDSAVREAVARSANALVGGTERSALVIDESAFAKKGTSSAGVSRQWNGRLGKTENSQVGVYAGLAAGAFSTPIDAELFLPKEWCKDPDRCRKAGIPEAAMSFQSKPELALKMIDRQIAAGVRFRYVLADGLYGNSGWLLRELSLRDIPYVLAVHADSKIFLEDPTQEDDSTRQSKSRPKRLDGTGMEVREYAKTLTPAQWSRRRLRVGENGPVEAYFHLRTVWVWQQKWKTALPLQLLIRKDLADSKISYAICHAAGHDGLMQLAYFQGLRHFIERSFQDAKSEVGMGDYQVRKWRGWNHHMTMTMVAMLFILRHRVLFHDEHPLLSARDIREMFEALLPQAYTGPEATIERMQRRHRLRQQAAESKKRLHEAST